MSTLIQVRGVKPSTKKIAEDVFRNLGLSTSAAIKLFLNQVAITKSIPFRPTTITENGLSPDQEDEILLNMKDDSDEITFSNVEDLITDLRK